MNKLKLLIFFILSISVSLQSQEFDLDDFEFHGSSKNGFFSNNKGWFGSAKGILVYGKGSMRTFNFSHINTELDQTFNPTYNALNLGGSVWVKGFGFGYDRGILFSKTQLLTNGEESFSKGSSSMFYIHKSLFIGKRLFLYTSCGLGNQKIEFSIYNPSELTMGNAFQTNNKLMSNFSYKSMTINPELNIAYTLLGRRTAGLTLISSVGYNKSVGDGEWSIGHLVYDGGGAMDLSNAYIMFGISLSGIR